MTNQASESWPDLQREARIGFAEVIYCEGKTDEQLGKIAAQLFAHHKNVLATRCNQEQFELMRKLNAKLQYHSAAKLAYLHGDKTLRGRGKIAVVTAGTTDIPVAEAAAITAEVMGNVVERYYDLGVAGLHRLLQRREALMQAEVIIAVAGMEGALPSVLGGLLPAPIIALPTSVGYGANLQGITAMLAMLSSCAPGITVVNVDNGFGAGYAAARINRKR
ncbi:MAG: nickel pincer cofactor biosynthesis protein LarB [Oligosphaeraceae bacterium]|jgi:NCAIR mutase (PurE)-related protein|nr:nickel pincer cofactor biosynthesis protein LarB [Oligosphaeraceae bacterium]